MMFQGVEMMQKREMKRVARKMEMYFGQMPVTSLEKGYEPGEGLVGWDVGWEGKVGHTGSDLVADGGEHEGKGCEELGGARVKVGDHVGHIPVEGSPEVHVCRGDEDGGQGTERADHGEREELVAASEAVLGEAEDVVLASWLIGCCK